MLAMSSRSIGNSAAWKLINGLRQSRDRFSYRPAAPPAASTRNTRSTRTHELQTALSLLSAEIRKTFTILPLELLLHLEEEQPDDASQSSFESDSEPDDESSTDSGCDDASSVSSAASVPAQPRADTASASARPSSSQARSLLQSLCSLLEARVNQALVPVQLGPLEKATSYPRLVRLVQYVQSLPTSAGRLELIPTLGSAPTPFLFNVSEVAERVAAFNSLRDPAQARPRKETRRQMLAEVEVMKSPFLVFNIFVNSLQISIGSLDSLAERPGQSLTSSASFASFAALEKFRQQTSAAFRAIFSQFGLCPQREQTKHNIFLQLPEWEDVSDCRSADAKRDLPTQLFFMSCLCSDWQPANAYLLQSEHIDACRKQKLCRALSSARDNGRALKFYVSEALEATAPGEIPVHIPKDPTSGRRHDDSLKLRTESFWTLVKNDYFARTPTMESVLRAGDDAAVFGIDQRKSLAVKLVLGLMLSMDSDRIIGTWKPRRIHSLRPQSKKFTVFVSINENNDTGGPKGLSLAKWDISRDRGPDDDDLQPLPPFTLLAKALLQIARGERLRGLKIARHPEAAFRDGWKKLRKLVEEYMRKVISGDDVDREVLPFLHAAINCLDFHMLYQKHAWTSQSTARSTRMEIAWNLVFTDILYHIDSSLTLGGLDKPGMNGLTGGDPYPSAEESPKATTENPGKIPSPETPKEAYPFHEVALFNSEDEEGLKEIKRAMSFFYRLENFHESYSSFVADRKIESGVESPPRVRIAVLDTGIDFGHSGIAEAKGKGRVKEEWCHSWVGRENDIQDEDEGLHGTNCAYILQKAAPEAEIYVEEVFQRNSLKLYQAQNIAKAIDHAVETWNVDIVSMSFGLRPPPLRPNADQAQQDKAVQDFECLVDGIQEVIRSASMKTIMFAAASNNGKNERRAFPARYDPWVICVHASDGNGNDGGINPPMESGPNFMTLGMGLELLEKCWEGGPGRTGKARYEPVYRSGTSFATPIAAGVAATVLDLAARASAIEKRTRKKLRRSEDMRKVLRLMSTPKHDSLDQFCFLAPWNLWSENWQWNETKCRTAWNSINDLFVD